MWSWQRELLAWRVCGLLESTPSPRELNAVMHVMDAFEIEPNANFWRGTIEALLSAEDQPVGKTAMAWNWPGPEDSNLVALVGEHAEALWERARDPASSVRIECARLMCVGVDPVRGKAAAEILVAHIEQAPRTPLSQVAIATLTRSPNPGVIEVVETLSDHPSPNVRNWVARRVADGEKLHEMCFDPDQTVRMAAFDAMAQRQRVDEIAGVIRRVVAEGTPFLDEYFERICESHFGSVWMEGSIEMLLDEIMNGPDDFAALTAALTLTKMSSELRRPHDWAAIEARARRLETDADAPARVSMRASELREIRTPDSPPD